MNPNGIKNFILNIDFIFLNRVQSECNALELCLPYFLRMFIGSGQFGADPIRSVRVQKINCKFYTRLEIFGLDNEFDIKTRSDPII